MKKIFTFIAAVLFAGSMMAANLLTIDFTQGQGEWTIDNKELGGVDFVWAQSNQYGMKATGYVNSTNHATEAWLISPAIDLSAVEAATLSFSHARRYGDNSQLSVKAKAGEGAWADLSVSAWPDGSSWTFIDATADLASYVGQAGVQIAFVYTSTAEGGATWEIKSVTVSDQGGAVTPVDPTDDADVTFTAADFAGQGVSGTGGEVTATKEGVTISTNKGFGHSAALRVYKGGSFSVVSATEQIGKIVFTFGSYQGTPKDGGLATEVVVNAKEYQIASMESAAYMEKIQIYFGEYEAPEPVEIEPITVAEALTIAQALTPEKTKSASTTEKYSVKGFVVGISTKNANTFYLADEAGAYGEFEAYKCASVDYEVAEGDLVIVTGKIQHYWGEGDNGEYHSYEISNGTLKHVYGQGIENVVMTEKAQKVIVDGVLYIVRDGKMFNVQGAQVR